MATKCGPEILCPAALLAKLTEASGLTSVAARRFTMISFASATVLPSRFTLP